MKRLTLLIALLAGLLLPAFSAADLRQEMVKLDKVYIAATYLLSDAQSGDVVKLVKLESAALANLKQALASGDRAQIAKAAAGIKPNFAKLFMIFANFEPYRTQGAVQ